MEVCPVLKHDISQLAAEVSEQVLDGNNGGMERGGGIGEGRGGGWRCGTAERRVVQEDGAAAKMSVQVSLFIVPPSWATLPGPDHHHYAASISPQLISRSTFSSESCHIKSISRI